MYVCMCMHIDTLQMKNPFGYLNLIDYPGLIVRIVLLCISIICLYVHTYTYVHVYALTYTYIHTYVFVCTYLRMYMYTYTHTRACMHTHRVHSEPQLSHKHHTWSQQDPHSLKLLHLLLFNNVYVHPASHVYMYVNKGKYMHFQCT